MGMFTVDKWPLVFVSAAMIVMAIVDGWKFKVPNRLTFPVILGGWALGLAYDLSTVPAGTTDHGSRLAASLLGTLVGFLLLLPLLLIKGVGEGDVKMQMGYGSWIGAYFGLYPGANNSPSALEIIFYGFCAGVIVGGVLGFAMIVAQRQFRTNLENAREILTDLATSDSIGAIADKATARKPRLKLLPYGIPLGIGFVGYLLYLYI